MEFGPGLCGYQLAIRMPAGRKDCRTEAPCKRRGVLKMPPSNAIREAIQRRAAAKPMRAPQDGSSRGEPKEPVEPLSVTWKMLNCPTFNQSLKSPAYIKQGSSCRIYKSQGQEGLSLVGATLVGPSTTYRVEAFTQGEYILVAAGRRGAKIPMTWRRLVEFIVTNQYEVFRLNRTTGDVSILDRISHRAGA